MLRKSFCQIIFSDGSTFVDSLLLTKNKYVVLKQDFNTHPFWVGHSKEKKSKEKAYLLNFHNRYKVKNISNYFPTR
jgi:ribosomal protein L31